ncbi:unknown [Bacteroides sp. CAG:770]|nr:unknown [Bacteroides sp. CAG:770]
MIPDMPEISVRGRNTQSIVNVEAMMEIPTSSVPWTAASFGFSPLSMWVVMFSSATMESSTTIPIAMDSADIDMIFNVLPVANR